MINHIQTLLLNQSASKVSSTLDASEYGYIDPSFVEVKLDKNVSRPYSVLFNEDYSGPDGLLERLREVKLLLPFFEVPELSPLMSAFDDRVCMPPHIRCDTVFDFFSVMSVNGDASSVPSLLSSQYVMDSFTPTGNQFIDKFVATAKTLFESGGFVQIRAGSALFSIALHIEASRLKGI